MMYCLGIAASLTALRLSPPGVFWLQWVLVFCLGFCIYGPQMLIGLCGAELVGPESVGASEGFLGWIAYLGAANAGVPLSLIVKNMGWGAYFNTLTAAALIAFCIMAPMFKLQSHVQREKMALLEGGGDVAVAAT
jgi:MFS transporter, OPA family, sugar phosphate sensor protein UhpC